MHAAHVFSTQCRTLSAATVHCMSDLRTYHHQHHTQFAHSCTIYVGLAQARPNELLSVDVVKIEPLQCVNIHAYGCPIILTQLSYMEKLGGEGVAMMWVNASYYRSYTELGRQWLDKNEHIPSLFVSHMLSGT